jgi:hypothetical protein
MILEAARKLAAAVNSGRPRKALEDAVAGGVAYVRQRTDGKGRST